MPEFSDKPAATLSLDLDNLWSYLRTRGDSEWRDYASFLDRAVPRMLTLLDSMKLKITIFVVGRDVELPQHRDVFSAILNAGHELGNHSFEHPVDLHRASPSMVSDEIERTENAIEGIGGRRPVGFRGPSFRLSETILKTLALRGYRYDASTFPTFAGPLARTYYRAKNRLNVVENNQIGDLFGSLQDGLRPLNPYRWDIDGTTICEVPISTFPFIRMPIHLTYINFIADYSKVLADAYLNSALVCSRLFNVAPSLLLHASDFIGKDDPDHPKFLPGMKRGSEEKIEYLHKTLENYRTTFNVMTIEQYVEKVLTTSELKSLSAASHV